MLRAKLVEVVETTRSGLVAYHLYSPLSGSRKGYYPRTVTNSGDIDALILLMEHQGQRQGGPLLRATPILYLLFS